MKKQLNIFMISSSLPIFFITFIYIGIAFNKNQRPTSVPYEFFPIIIPLFFGVFGIFNYYTISHYSNNYSLLLGSLFGLILSIIGRFYLNLPTKIFNISKKTKSKVHLHAIIIYGLIFRFILTPIQTIFI